MMENRIRKIALISSLTATAVASRVILSPLPNIKPVGALCLFAGIIGGPIVGFLVGSLTMVVTDVLFFGAGLWTFITSFSMGIVGLLGYVFVKSKGSFSRFNLFVFTFFSILFYDIFTSVASTFIFGNTSVIASLVMLFLPTPIPFGPAHEITNALFASLVIPEVYTRVKRDLI
jgi:uncharacterized membrane protein